MENKKILMIITPAHGHINPLLGIANELRNRGAKVIFYSFPEFKEKIVKSGVEFREYPIPKELREPSNLREDDILAMKLVELVLDGINHTIPYFVEKIKEEKPDLIIYDLFNLYGQYLLNYLRNNHGKIEGVPAAPPTLFFSSTFAMKENIFTIDQTFEITDHFMRAYIGLKEKQNELNKKFSLTIEDPIKACQVMDEKMVLVSIFPEFQPKRELFDDSFHFIGSCVSSVRNQPITDPKLKSFIDLFNPVNPIQSLGDVDKRNSNGLKLVYVSLGTIFQSLTIFETIIETFKKFNEEDPNNKSLVDFKNLRVIFSLGQNVLNIFKEKIAKENYHVPENILLLPSAPQIEILQRASLFITHCGMNGTSETLKYGVPIIAVPIESDQPSIAKRVTDEMNIGIRMNKNDFKLEDLRKNIHEIFKNNSYLNNSIKYAAISAKYDGTKNGASLIARFIRENSN